MIDSEFFTIMAMTEGPTPAQERDHLAEQCDTLLRENERLRAALELIAGNTSDKLQALQAKSALDNIGPKS